MLINVSTLTDFSARDKQEALGEKKNTTDATEHQRDGERQE